MVAREGKSHPKNDNTPSSTQQKQRKNNNKRGDKKKNYKNNNNDDDADDTQFRQQLQTQSLSIRTMSPDGNCLFRSISDQLYNDSGSSHHTIRNQICNHISNNTSEYQHFLLMDENDEDIMDIESYVTEMRNDSTWGSDVEIVAACRVYNVGIKVFSCVHDGGVLRFGDRTDSNGSGGGEDLLLSYHGNDHYNSVHPMDGSNCRRQKERLLQKQQKQEEEEMLKGERYSTRATRKNSKKKNSNNNDDEEDDKEDGEDESELSTSREATNVQPSSSTTSCTNATTDNTDNTSKKKKRTIIKTPPKKSSPCPCGSGMKYKKCCFAREKSKKRLARMNHSSNNHDYDRDDKDDDKENEVEDDGEEEKKEEFIGDFKVLNI